MQTTLRTVLSQYANSPVLLQLIESFNEWVDPAADFQAFYDLVWNLDTAVGEGLDVWGRIVGVGRVLAVTVSPLSFGFQDGAGTPDVTAFGEGPFYTGAVTTQNYALSDEAYHTLILIKAAANIAASSAPALNSLLRSLFAARGRAYVTDGGDMTMRYVFEFYLKPYEVAIIMQAGALPNPTGVGVTYQQILANATFGFAEAGAGYAPFGSGTFYPNNGLAVVS